MTEKNSKEEIDILSLFSLVGKKTNSLLVLIINLFISILNLIVRISYLMKKKYLLLLISFIIGTLIGSAYNKFFYVPKYTSSLTLSPNFGSTYHLYEDIKFYQSLIDQNDFEKLNTYLNIDSQEAMALINISIEPYIDESLKLKNYQELVIMADSVTALTLSYEKFVNKIPFDAYLVHILTLKSTNNKVPPQLEQSIINSHENNKYYSNIKNTYLENLKIKKEYIKSSIKKIDTLLFSNPRNFKGDFNSAKSGTTIVLDENQNQSIDLELFNNYSKLNNELIYINKELNKNANILNIISSFPKTAKQSNKDQSYIKNGGVISFLLTFILLLLYEINKFLNKTPRLQINLLNYKK